MTTNLHTFHCQKLVRDRKPADLERQGLTLETKTLEGPDLVYALFDKIGCEVYEAEQAYQAGHRTEIKNELSDGKNALDGLIQVLKIENFEALCAEREEKFGCYSLGVCLHQSPHAQGCCPHQGLKLVRNKKPDFLKAQGQDVKVSVIQGADLIKHLFEKIQCEKMEAIVAYKAGNHEETVKELTDVANALCSLVDVLKIEDFKAICDQRQAELGSYVGGCCLTKLHVPHDHPEFKKFEAHCSAHTHNQSCSVKNCS